MPYIPEFKVLAPIYKQLKHRHFKDKKPGDLVWFNTDQHDLVIEPDGPVYIYCKYLANYLTLRDVKTICFWSGVRDASNGRIYEDDIVEFSHPDHKKSLKGVVKFRQGAFIIVAESGEIYHFNEVQNVKVIGNIHTPS